MGQNVGVPAARFRSICQEERKANIDLTSIQVLSGTFRDPTGAAFSNEYAVELRDPNTGYVLKTELLHRKGQFSMDGLKLGRVNLLLVHRIDGQVKRTGFENPIYLQCGDGPTCSLQIVLKIGSTDDIKNGCPLT